LYVENIQHLFFSFKMPRQAFCNGELKRFSGISLD